MKNIRREILLDKSQYMNYNYYFIVPFLRKINKNSKIRRLYFYILDPIKEWAVTIYNTDLKDHIFIVEKDFLEYLENDQIEEGYYKVKLIYEEQIGNFIKDIYKRYKNNKLQFKYPVYLNLINK